jgi:hypothetical protein
MWPRDHSLGLLLTFLLLVLLASSTSSSSPASSSDSSSTAIYDKLRALQLHINSTPEWCYGTKNSRTVKDFLSNTWSAHAGGLNVIVYPFCMTTTEFGNRLGNYITEVACAEAAGMHFVAVHKNFDLSGSYHGNSTSTVSEQRKQAYLRALPDIIIHKNPVERPAAEKNVKQHCGCSRYCWGVANAPWVNRTGSIKQYLQVRRCCIVLNYNFYLHIYIFLTSTHLHICLQVATKAYLATVDTATESTVVSTDVDLVRFSY